MLGVAFVSVPRVRPPARSAGLAPGLLVVAALVVAAQCMERAAPRVSVLLWAVLLGVAAAPVVAGRTRTSAGVRFSTRTLLRAGVALIGLRVSTADLLTIGATGAVVIVATLATTLLVTVWLGRALRVRREMALLIGTGTAVCGASAIASVNAVVDAREQEVGYAMAIITVLGTVAMVALPWLAGAIGLTDEQAGLWIGASVHEVAQVAAAGAAVSVAALAIAMLSKLARVVLLGPTVAGIALAANGDGRAQAGVPGFIVAFLGLVAVRSLCDLPAWALDVATFASTTLLAAGLAGLGLGIRIGPLRQEGARPLLLGVAATLTATGVSLGLIGLLLH